MALSLQIFLTKMHTFLPDYMTLFQKTEFFRADQHHKRQERSNNEWYDQNEYRNNFTKILLSLNCKIAIHLITPQQICYVIFFLQTFTNYTTGFVHNTHIQH
jgi:hypothetical protein